MYEKCMSLFDDQNIQDFYEKQKEFHFKLKEK